MIHIIGKVIGIVVAAGVFIFAWESGRKRKIGLTVMSFLILIPPFAFLASLISLFTKKIDKVRKYPTYEQRLPYENPTAMLVASILLIIVSAFFIIFGLMGGDFIPFVTAAIFFVWAISLFPERKKLLSAKITVESENTTNGIQKTDNVSNIRGTSLKISHPYTKLFVFESDIQMKVTDDISSEPEKAIRQILVERNDLGQYSVSISDKENDVFVLKNVPMRKNGFSSIDDCLSLISDDGQGDYTLNIFYKGEQVDKCVMHRKSKNVFIHYCKE